MAAQSAKASTAKGSRMSQSRRTEIRFAAVRPPTVQEVIVQRERAQRERYGQYFDSYFENLRRHLDIEKALESSGDEKDIESIEVLKLIEPEGDARRKLANIHTFYTTFQQANKLPSQTYYASRRLKHLERAKTQERRRA